MAEAQLRDQHGNPIPLTDQHGNPVVLTDEHGNPVHVTGVATTATPAAIAGCGFGNYGGAGATTTTGATTVGDLIATQPRDTRELSRSSSSSSSSSEDDGQGGRRKKGVKDKIKEKLPGRKNIDQHSPTATTTATTTTTTTTAATGVPHTTLPTATNPNPNHPEHHKKGIMEKIKEKLPGHHSH